VGWENEKGENRLKGMSLDEVRNSHLAIEMALLRVRHRHEKPGTATSTRSGNY
jgi:hypothetical protein